MMEGIIVHFRQGRHHQNTRQVVIKVAETAEEAKKVVGKKAVWTSPGKNQKKIVGRISALHGRKGSVRAIFEEKCLPGQAIGQKIKIE